MEDATQKYDRMHARLVELEDIVSDHAGVQSATTGEGASLATYIDEMDALRAEIAKHDASPSSPEAPALPTSSTGMGAAPAVLPRAAAPPVGLAEKRRTERTRPQRSAGLYVQSVIGTRVALDVGEIGKNLPAILHQRLRNSVEGVCIAQGYVKPGSVLILTYSSGVAYGAKVAFDVSYQCLLCRPVEGMLIRGCVVKNITKAGIRAVTKERPSPVIVYISRDHMRESDAFDTVTEGDIITARVIGQRYELRDDSISVVALLADQPTKPTVRLGTQRT